MGERYLDALVTVFTGGLSGYSFHPTFPPPPFVAPASAFFFDSSKMLEQKLGSFAHTQRAQEDFTKWRDAQELLVRELARTMKPHANVIGFDMGSEIDNFWPAPTQDSDAWMTRMFELMNEALPEHLHVNGVLHSWFIDQLRLPWGERIPIPFSPQARRAPFPVMHAYPHWDGAEKFGGPMDPPSIKLLAAKAALIRSYAGSQQKPVWAGEFNTCIVELSEKDQATWLEKAVLAAIDEGVSWFSYWDTHDLDPKFWFPRWSTTWGC